MANTIRIKRRSSAGAAGSPATLTPAELAYNENDNTLYYGFGDGGVGLSSSVIPIAGSGAFMTTGTTQTVSAAKTFSNITISGGSISGITDLAIADGGTGSSTAAGALTNLGAYPATNPTGYTTNVGTVTSIGLQVYGGIFTVTNSPVTSSGDISLFPVSQSKNTFYAGPISISTSSPSFRAITAQDLPALDYLPITGGTVSGAVVITGDLTINGTTTTVSSSTLTVADKNIELAKGSTTEAGATGGGITLHGLVDHTILYTTGTSSWDFSEHMNLVTGKIYKINGVSVLSATALMGVDIDGGSF
jgi:hypothetical protein